METEGYAVNKAEDSKSQSYANTYDKDIYEFSPLVMELGGCACKRLEKLIKDDAKKAG